MFALIRYLLERVIVKRVKRARRDYILAAEKIMNSKTDDETKIGEIENFRIALLKRYKIDSDLLQSYQEILDEVLYRKIMKSESYPMSMYQSSRKIIAYAVEKDKRLKISWKKKIQAYVVAFFFCLLLY